MKNDAARPERATVDGRRARAAEFEGHVDSIAAATGAKFSLLPPENATGNYVKVVQRVPVKIVLEPGQDPEHLLRPGHVGHADRLHEVALDDRAAEHRVVNPWIVAIAVMFATFMEVLDTTVVNVSLPHIAGNLVGDDRRIDVGADVVPRRQRDRAAADRLARADLRAQAPADGVGRRVHDLVAALRPRAEPAAARRLPADPGGDRRRDAAAVAGGAARGVSAARARQGHGLLGPRHRRRADPRARCSADG